MGRRFVIWLHPSFYNVISLNKTAFKIAFDLYLVNSIEWKLLS